MKLTKLFFSAIILLAFAGCSSSTSGPADLFGPDLDVAELSTIKIDQLKFVDAGETDLDGVPEVAVYLRCKDDDKYLACAGQEQGLDIIKKAGIAYGRMNIPFVLVDGAEGTCLDVEVVLVEKNSNDCPATVDEDDDIIGISSPLKINEDGDGTLLENVITVGDGGSWIRLMGPNGTPSTDMEVAPALTEAILTLDQLSFTRPEITGDTDYKIVVRGDTFRCEASFDNEATGVDSKDAIYGSLGIQLLDDNSAPCAITEDNKNEYVSIILTILTNSGNTKETLTTGTSFEKTVGDLVDDDGIKEKFENDGGFVRFYNIAM